MSETEIFKALADPNRRTMLERLGAGERTAGELRADFAISQPAVSQHLAVLRAAGLVRERRAGRHVHYSLAPDGMAPLHEWLARTRAFWPDRIEALRGLLREMDQ